jgi:hypothetical protein
MQDIDFEAGVWAIVTVTGGKMLIGSIENGRSDIIDQMEERKPLLITQAFELVSQHLPMQDPATGRTGFQRLVRCAPVNNCLGPAKMTVIAEGLQFFLDMQEGDAEQHKSLVRQLEAMLIEARLSAAGIVKPNMKGPSGPIVRP